MSSPRPRRGSARSNLPWRSVRRCSHVVIATFEPLCGKETVEVLGWQKHVFAVGSSAVAVLKKRRRPSDVRRRRSARARRSLERIGKRRTTISREVHARADEAAYKRPKGSMLNTQSPQQISAPACVSPGGVAQAGAQRPRGLSKRWSSSRIDRLRSKTVRCLVIGKATWSGTTRTATPSAT